MACNCVNHAENYHPIANEALGEGQNKMDTMPYGSDNHDATSTTSNLFVTFPPLSGLEGT